MFYLLDVNVLIAAVDQAHEFHESFHAWYSTSRFPKIATCPITENGFLRIYGHPSYPSGPGSPVAVLPLLQALKARPGCQFLPDDVSLAAAGMAGVLQGMAPKHLTDIYLLALAMKHHGRLATFDRRLAAEKLPGGAAAVTLIPTA